jgi:hypothetical protein
MTLSASERSASRRAVVARPIAEPTSLAISKTVTDRVQLLVISVPHHVLPAPSVLCPLVPADCQPSTPGVRLNDVVDA